MTEIAIRPAVLADAPSLAEVGRATFVETFVEGFGIPYPAEDMATFIGEQFAPDVIAARLADPAQAWWVAQRDGAVLGFANTGPNGLPHPDARPGEVELKRLYVSKSAQGLGLGTRLLTQAMAWMDAHGAGAQWIGVWSGNEKAQRLYAAYGFQKAGEYRFPVGRWLDDEFILKRA